MTRPMRHFTDPVEPGSFVYPNKKEELIMEIGKLLAEANLLYSELEIMLNKE